MNKVLLPKMTVKALAALNVRRPSSDALAAAGHRPGRPALPHTYLPKFA